MQIQYRKLLPLLAGFALSVFLAGCSEMPTTSEKTSNDEVIQITKSQQLQELTFENGSGRALLIFEENGAECLIFAEGLNPKETYTISLVGDNGASPGVMFGPIENVKLRIGFLEDEIMFKPNTEGELFVSMRNPMRILTAAKKEMYFKIESENKKRTMKTSSFLVHHEAY